LDLGRILFAATTVKHLISRLAVSVLLLASFSAAQTPRTFIGVITDSMCPQGDHSQMQMGPTDAACAMACNDVHGAAFILYDGKFTYQLTDQKAPAKFAGQKVQVVGTLDDKSKTIRVQSINAVK
jgi:hypothetical protein